MSDLPDRGVHLEQALGYRFRNPDLLSLALTHRSAGREHNERLEFLGDGILNGIIGEALYRACPDRPEGDLSRLRASLVREEALAAVAERLQLGAALRLGPGELKSGGFRRSSILADTLEAVLGAIYLDGGFTAARDACLRLFEHELEHLPDPEHLKDAKTRLQELLQSRGRVLPVYEIKETQGPAHRQTFTAVCRLPDGTDVTEGSSSNRKAAEQEAAERMLSRLNA